MKVVTSELTLQTTGETHMADITNEVSRALRKSQLSQGIVTLFVPGSTAALTTLEYEPGLLQDFPALLQRIAPKHIAYEHQKRWGDNNGHSHVRAALVGASLTVPFVHGELTLGTWQQIVFIELDIRRRSRTVIVQILGE